MHQGSEEWLNARLGKVTASRIADMMTKTKTGWGAGRKDLLIQLCIERLSGKPYETYTNAAMQWGVETEAQARAWYTLEHGEVEEVGFINHPQIEMSGASPDGLVAGDGMLEIKCPKSKTHFEFLKTGTIDRKYLYQMQWQMACTGRAWCDFLSFDPRLPEQYQARVVRVQSDNELISELTEAVKVFLAEVEEELEKIKVAA